jgi:hypothetical protein
MSVNQPDLSQVTPPASNGDTIMVGSIANSQDMAIGPGAVAQVFQQMLLPDPADYRYAALRMIEEYEEVFGGREELVALDAFLLGEDQPCTPLLTSTRRSKTAVPLHWIARVQRGNWTVVFAPISIRFRTADERAPLDAIARGFGSTPRRNRTAELAGTHAELIRPLIAECFLGEPPQQRRLLIGPHRGQAQARPATVDRNSLSIRCRPTILPSPQNTCSDSSRKSPGSQWLATWRERSISPMAHFGWRKVVAWYNVTSVPRSGPSR